ncbi:MAG: GTP cyclohydrolase FolE2 [Steroidobacteraceae bacterium]
MTAAAGIAFLPDVQARVDHRDLRIDAAGIKSVRMPLTIRTGGTSLPTIATVSMSVSLPAVSKGTHMSRFVELLESQTRPLDQQGFRALLFAMLQRLDARSGAIEMQFPFFVRKTAPVSGAQSRLDCDICWRGSVPYEGRYSFRMRVTVPATSLCPCSKEISAYGAHNQRSQISIEAELADDMAIEELIAIAERNASCEVYGLLKRADEKHVTERAYDNPKFAEDLVRDVALELNREARVRAYVVEAENFESIHNHSAFARLVRPNPQDSAAQSRQRHGQRVDSPHPETAA